MIDLNNVDNLFDSEHAEMIRYINKGLDHLNSMDCTPMRLTGNININSTLIDIAIAFNEFEIFEENYKKKKNSSPHWGFVLKGWIDELNVVIGTNNTTTIDHLGQITTEYELVCPLAALAFGEISRGENNPLYEYRTSLVGERNGKRYFSVLDLKFIAVGVVIAHKLPLLIDELNKVNGGKLNYTEPATSKQKLNWIGKKNQLYHVLKQLKEQRLISNTLDELTDFIIENVVGFEKVQRTTISGAIGRKDSVAKGNRVILDKEMEE